MRLPSLALVVLALAAPAVLAQQPPAQQPPPPAAAANPALDRYMLRWEQEMQKVQTLAATLNLTEKDKTFETVKKFAGFAQYMKAGAGTSGMNLAMLELREEGKKEISHKYICTGPYLYQFLPAQKEVRAFELPKAKAGQVADDNFLSFLFGIKAAEAKRRYDLRLAKEDQWYVYVDIQPRSPRDRADFQKARIVLNKDTFLPRQLWFEQPNGSEVLWDIPRIMNGAKVNRADFDAPRMPPGWKMTQVPQNADLPPRVVRPGQGP
jgi:TIGR03009 family protein